MSKGIFFSLISYTLPIAEYNHSLSNCTDCTNFSCFPNPAFLRNRRFVCYFVNDLRGVWLGASLPVNRLISGIDLDVNSFCIKYLQNNHNFGRFNNAKKLLAITYSGKKHSSTSEVIFLSVRFLGAVKCVIIFLPPSYSSKMH